MEEELELVDVSEEGRGTHSASPGTAQAFQSKAVQLILVDPDVAGPHIPGIHTTLDWDWQNLALGHTESIGTIRTPTLEGIKAVFDDLRPNKRLLRIVMGAMTTPLVAAGAAGPTTASTFHNLIFTNMVEAFLMMTQSVPVVLRGVLHRTGVFAIPPAPQTPPVNTLRTLQSWYEPDEERPVFFADIITDSEEDDAYFQRKRKKMKGLPHRDQS